MVVVVGISLVGINWFNELVVVVVGIVVVVIVVVLIGIFWSNALDVVVVGIWEVGIYWFNLLLVDCVVLVGIYWFNALVVVGIFLVGIYWFNAFVVVFFVLVVVGVVWVGIYWSNILVVVFGTLVGIYWFNILLVVVEVGIFWFNELVVVDLVLEGIYWFNGLVAVGVLFIGIYWFNELVFAVKGKVPDWAFVEVISLNALLVVGIVEVWTLVVVGIYCFNVSFVVSKVVPPVVVIYSFKFEVVPIVFGGIYSFKLWICSDVDGIKLEEILEVLVVVVIFCFPNNLVLSNSEIIFPFFNSKFKPLGTKLTLFIFWRLSKDVFSIAFIFPNIWLGSKGKGVNSPFFDINFFIEDKISGLTFPKGISTLFIIPFDLIKNIIFTKPSWCSTLTFWTFKALSNNWRAWRGVLIISKILLRVLRSWTVKSLV